MDQHFEVPEITSFGNYISLFYRYGSSFLTHEFLKYDIGYGQIQFLVNLYIHDGLKHEELTKLVRVDKATTTRAISKLYNNNYVFIKQDTNDKRIYRVYLTEKANSIRDEVFAIVTSWEGKLLNALSHEEQEQLFAICKKIASFNNL